jgi:hypothetical protein
MGSNLAAPISRPVCAVFALIAALVLVVISWLAAVLLGSFIPGPLSAFLTWLWFGVALVLLQCLWCSLYRQGRYAVERRARPDSDGLHGATDAALAASATGDSR